MLSIWDSETKNTARFDLWTSEMTRDEMSIFVFQSLLMMAETYSKATNNQGLAAQLQSYAEDFGVKAGLIKKDTDDQIKPFKLEL